MIGDILYNLFIMPLELIFEVIFWFLRSYPALAIVAISIVMNFLALPLYKRADAIHEEERDKVASMADRVAKIKKAFKGDERYMVLTTYYKEQHYKPIYALKSTFSLLLQVPFFMAAYNFLSRPGLLDGHSLWILSDLGKPDQLLQFGTFSVNLLPIIMTLINVVSSYIYLRGFSLRDKIQTYGIAAVFLVLLYNSPSGLVFYWTLNQVFSVLKNIFMKLVKSKKAHSVFFSMLGVALLIVLICTGLMTTPKKAVLGAVLFLICQIPLISGLVKRRHSESLEHIKPLKTSCFVLGCVFMTVLMGIVIPMSVISSSPTEFATAATSPSVLVINNVCICAGFFIIWLGIFYYMSTTFVRNLFTYAILIISGVSILDFMVFAKKLGVMSTYLVYDVFPSFTRSEKWINLVCVIALAAVLVLAMKYLSRFVNYLYLILILGSVILAGFSIVNTAQTVSAARSSEQQFMQQTEQADGVRVSNEVEKIIPLSKEGHNVVILMMDRAISGYLPYIFHEKPELEKQFEGFTYYPNMLSFGGHTNMGVPAIFGGYEYTPASMNARPELSLREKHDEALLLMPTLFSEEGYQVTVCDPAYAGYSFYPPDLSIYDKLDHVTARITYGAYSDELMAVFSPTIQKTQRRNFFFYSLMKCVPMMLHNTVYNGGNYYAAETGNVLSCSDEFLYSYSVLYALPELTDIRDENFDTLMMMDNDTTHSNTILQTPEYEPVANLTSNMYDNPERFTLNGVSVVMDTETQIGHYHCNMAGFLKLGEWMDFLRDNGVYDNTRIIIVSDHGNGLGQFEDLLIDDTWDAEWLNSLLLYKDFNDQDAFRVSDEFMMTADVPMLAMKGLIRNMTNPFTGNEITEDVNKEEQPVTSSHHWNINTYHGNTYDTSDGDWWVVHGNVHDRNCWEKVFIE